MSKLLGFLFAFVVLGLLAPVGAFAAEPFTVMSFNLRGDFDGGVATDKPTGWLSKSGDHRRELALRLASDVDPDLLGVQEAYRNQVQELDAALPGHAFVGVGRDDGAEAGEHSCLYYRADRFELVDSGTFWLSETPDKPSTYPGAACPRVATWAVLRDHNDGEPAGRELLVVNTHWDHVSAEARSYSATLIRQRLEELAGDRPAIVMGDLNVTERKEPITTLLGDGPRRLVDSFREVQPQRGKNERTYHDFKGGEEGWRIDYIVHTEGLRATDAEIVRTSYDGRYPSDHYPVTASIEWK
ncbi:endonuclease/exonuclease/phosphatase family protein [Botrimarina mediterranea]|uniref:Endonuclease/Exonuclease/phosphatase family protein n=1 Tax=Botrimarina mediterranea TaxID=2528022 RepID=A0A518KE46_9BACT|nr:endonuclease/exonuclease/phosphatase family protein [Botrimarina mediterranea]QDV76061.1 Endonuclease/Exonuclease/phosphatase family protein [Botrimarina mediterranea]QDV80656.1 Endonuclease/Exonuclease/phosphatase family protein [Planctomycetes bacterium K2D]